MNSSEHENLADGTLSPEEWDAWLADNPAQAEELEIARRVHALLANLQAASIEMPAGFEARLMERVQNDVAFLDMLDLLLAGAGRTLIELLDLIFGLQPQPTSSPQSAS